MSLILGTFVACVSLYYLINLKTDLKLDFLLYSLNWSPLTLVVCLYCGVATNNAASLVYASELYFFRKFSHFSLLFLKTISSCFQAIQVCCLESQLLVMRLLQISDNQRVDCQVSRFHHDSYYNMCLSYTALRLTVQRVIGQGNTLSSFRNP